jgi:K+ transporter
VLLHHIKHNKVLHEQVVLLSVLTDRVPEVPPQKRVSVKELGQGFFQVIAHYGFMQSPNVPDVIRRCKAAGLKTAEGDISYFLGRETLLTTGKSGLARWRKLLFGFCPAMPAPRPRSSAFLRTGSSRWALRSSCKLRRVGSRYTRGIPRESGAVLCF